MTWVTPKSDFIPKKPLFICVLGNTNISKVPGLSGAGKTPEFTLLTPSGDAEIIYSGNIMKIPVMATTPPLDTPTPAVITRTALNLTKIPFKFVNAGLQTLPDPEVKLFETGAKTGGDFRKEDAVENPEKIFEKSKELGREVADETDLPVIGESIAGGTTTAQGILYLLGYDAKASSSCEENPLNLKEEVLNAGIKKHGLSFGCFKDKPFEAIRCLGDPMMPTVAGIVAGIKEKKPDMRIVLAGGTQMIAVYALIKHMNIPVNGIDLATTKYVEEDKTANFINLKEELGFNAYIADPGFGKSKLPGIRRYEEGTIKEGAGAGGAMFLAALSNVTQEDFLKEVENVCEILKAGRV
ncbi:MAG: TIGR00303 family protein [Methanosarcinaceae archaeon]|nr:TIGR00303 family protein [Methanosarcinaceae archaeon]